MEPSTAEREIARYERALDRAEALGLHEYEEAFETILKGLREVKRLDEEFTGDKPAEDY